MKFTKLEKEEGVLINLRTKEINRILNQAIKETKDHLPVNSQWVLIETGMNFIKRLEKAKANKGDSKDESK